MGSSSCPSLKPGRDGVPGRAALTDNARGGMRKTSWVWKLVTINTQCVSNVIAGIGVTMQIMARLIAGEAGTCGLDGKLAVAHVVMNRDAAGITGGWYGDAEPAAVDLAVAAYAERLNDITRGAIFLFSDNDLFSPAVQRIVADRVLTGVFRCHGSSLFSFR